MTGARAVATSSPGVDAIRTVLIEYQHAWNNHDMTALEELFTDDAHWVNIVGMHWQGKAAIIKAHSVFHRTIFQKTELNFRRHGNSRNNPGRCRCRRYRQGRHL